MKKILLPLLFGTVLLVIILIVIVSSLSKTAPSDESQPTPTKVVVQLPTLQPNELAILSHLPKEVPDTPYLPMQKITLNFSDTVSSENINIQTNPPTRTSIIQGRNKKTIYITPLTFWTTGKTTITVLTTTISDSGKTLSQPYELSIITAPPPTIDPDINLP